jgi:hypothetical protein
MRLTMNLYVREVDMSTYQIPGMFITANMWLDLAIIMVRNLLDKAKYAAAHPPVGRACWPAGTQCLQGPEGSLLL